MISFPSLYFNTYTNSPAYSQDNYNHDLKSINICKCICPKCGACGFFHFHAKYTRYLSDSDTQLQISRIMCDKCQSTHALLPDVIIPYRYFSSPFILNLFTLYLKKRLPISKISSALNLSVNCVSMLVSYFEEHYKVPVQIINPYLNTPLNHDFSILFFYFCS